VKRKALKVVALMMILAFALMAVGCGGGQENTGSNNG
jgi:hypothetical protein